MEYIFIILIIRFWFIFLNKIYTACKNMFIWYIAWNLVNNIQNLLRNYSPYFLSSRLRVTNFLNISLRNLMRWRVLTITIQHKRNQGYIRYKHLKSVSYFQYIFVNSKYGTTYRSSLKDLFLEIFQIDNLRWYF